MDNLQSNIRSAIKSIDILIVITNSGATWETKYDIIFTQAQPLLDILNQIGIDGVVWDDTSPLEESDALELEKLESDVMAFVGALEEIRDELNIVLGAIELIPE